MQQHNAIGSQINTHVKKSDELMTQESEVIGTVIAELAATQGFVTNKAIILKLLEKLERETDIAQLDIYRTALEEVVHRTPDDLIL